MSEQNFSFDPNTPRTAHPGFGAALYGDIFENVDIVLNVAAGYTDLESDLREKGIETEVISVDPAYENDITYANRPNFVPAYAQKLPYGDNLFDMTLCQFGAQHIPDQDLGGVVREMIRVTKKADNENDANKGAVLINPVFRPKQMQAALVAAGLEDVAGLMIHDPKQIGLTYRKLVKPTLWIQKTDNLTAEKIDSLVAAVTGSGALKPTHRSLGEMVSRAVGGRSKK